MPCENWPWPATFAASRGVAPSWARQSWSKDLGNSPASDRTIRRQQDNGQACLARTGPGRLHSPRAGAWHLRGRAKAGARTSGTHQLQIGQYGVSKITVRHALRELALAGYIRREQGRGTFVGAPKLEQGPRELTSFTEEMRRHGYLASSRVLTQDVLASEGELA